MQKNQLCISSRIDEMELNHALPTRSINWLIAEYGIWMKEKKHLGFDLYLFTFMFDHVPGYGASRNQEMMRQVEAVYGRLATRVVKNPRSQYQARLLPRLVAMLDGVGYSRRTRESRRDVIVNDGTHVHAVVAALKTRWCSEGLDQHFSDNAGTYKLGNINRIHVEPIARRVAYTTEYGIKALKSPLFSKDDICILPKHLSELPNKRIRPARPGQKLSAMVEVRHATFSDGDLEKEILYLKGLDANRDRTTSRFAVFDFLAAVFELYSRLKRQINRKRRSRWAARRLARIFQRRLEGDPHPLLLILELASTADRPTKDMWIRALRKAWRERGSWTDVRLFLAMDPEVSKEATKEACLT